MLFWLKIKKQRKCCCEILKECMDRSYLTHRFLVCYGYNNREEQGNEAGDYVNKTPR